MFIIFCRFVLSVFSLCHGCVDRGGAFDANDEVVIKSVYDPSPVGYSLPASNAFTGFTTTGGNVNNKSALFNVKDTFDKGWYFYTKSGKTGIPFYVPASGSRHYNSGSLGDVTTVGICWVAGPYNRGNGRYLGFNSGTVGPLGYINRSFGMFVRSAEEKKMFLMCIGGR